jgi:Predicted membrane protein (DUF2207)
MWTAFKRYLSKPDSMRYGTDVSSFFERLLPYAIAFGYADKMSKQFGGANLAAPVWFVPYIAYGSTAGGMGHGGGAGVGFGGVADALGGMITSMGSVLSPPSSSGGAGGAGGAGGGGGGGGAGGVG